MKKIKRVFSEIALALCVSILGISGLFIGTNRTAHAIYSDDTTSYVKVNDIYNDTVGAINAYNVNTLLRYITGDAEITIETATETLNTMASNITTSTDIRLKSVTAGGYHKIFLTSCNCHIWRT